MKTKILMVCLGNICRSPLAEGRPRRHRQGQGGIQTPSGAAGRPRCRDDRVGPTRGPPAAERPRPTGLRGERSAPHAPRRPLSK